jgi:hypothetical protein
MTQETEARTNVLMGPPATLGYPVVPVHVAAAPGARGRPATSA